MFNTSSGLIDKTFEEVKDLAFQGSDYIHDNDWDNENDWDYDPGHENIGGFSPPWIVSILASIFLPFIFLLIVMFGIGKGISLGPINYRKKYKGEYYRDYPYEGPFEDTFYLLNSMGIANIETMITAFILKWIYLGDIETVKIEKGLIFKKEETNLKFINKNMDTSSVEGKLYYMMLSASGANKILENNEFSKWAQKNYKKVESWEKEAKDYSKNILKSGGYLKVEKKKVLFFDREDISPTEEGEKLKERVYKFMNYLLDFSLLNEHESINVGIWDNLMIWAGVLGITEKVAKEFAKLYPNYEVESIYRGNAIYIAHTFSRSISHASDTVHRSSGGGGFSSSGGGGGGSFGGGSGGGVR